MNSIQVSGEVTSQLYRIKKYNRLPSINSSSFYKKKRLINYALRYLQEAQSEEQKENLLNIIRLAVQDIFLTIDFIWDKEELNIIYKAASAKISIEYDWNLLKLRQSF